MPSFQREGGVPKALLGFCGFFFGSSLWGSFLLGCFFFFFVLFFFFFFLLFFLFLSVREGIADLPFFPTKRKAS